MTDYVIAGDTDSIFLPLLPLVRKKYDGDDQEEILKLSKIIISDIQEFANSTFDLYAKRYHNIDTHRWEVKQEMVAKRAFFGQAKKRYAMWIIMKNGLDFNELEIKGLDVVRSSFPKIFRSKMKQLVEDILHDIPVSELNQKVRTFKKEYKNSPIFDIMLPSSVKEISKYKDAIKGTPIHVKSAQNYNKLLALHKIESIPPIDDGDKIVYAYMQQNPFGFETMALKGQGEDPEPLVEFVERFIDRERVFQSTFISKLDTIWHDLGWGKVEQQEPNNFF